MFCEIEKIRIHYEIIGEGIPVVILHGWGPDHRMMTRCMEPVFAEPGHDGYMRIYPDLPGMGESSTGEYIDGSDSMLDVVIQFIEYVIPGKDFILAGESYGGYLARGVIHKMRQRILGVMLLCPIGDPLTQKENSPAHTVLERDDGLVESLTPSDREMFTGVNVLQTRRVWEEFRDAILPGLNAADFEFLGSHLGKRVPFSFDVDSPDAIFDRPGLFLVGRQDSMVGHRDLWKIIENYPRTSFVLLDKAGHNLQIEQDRLFRECVSEWLERVKG